MSSQKCLTVFKENKSILKTVSLTFRYCFVSTLIMLVIPGFPQAGCMVMRLGCNNVLVQGAYHCKCINHGSSNVNMNPLCLSAALGYNSTVKWTRCSSTYCEVTIKAVQLVCLGLATVSSLYLDIHPAACQRCCCMSWRISSTHTHTHRHTHTYTLPHSIGILQLVWICIFTFCEFIQTPWGVHVF